MGDELLVVRDAERPSRPLDREEYTLVLGCIARVMIKVWRIYYEEIERERWNTIS